MSEWSHVEEERRKSPNQACQLAPKKKLRIVRQNGWGPHRFAGTWRVPGYFCPGAFTADVHLSNCLLVTKWNLSRAHEDLTFMYVNKTHTDRNQTPTILGEQCEGGTF